MFQYLWKKLQRKQIFRSMFLAVSGLAIMCVLVSCILGFIWFRSARIGEERQKDGSMLYTSALTVGNYLQSVENAMNALQDDFYVKRLAVKESFRWDEDTNIAAKSIVSAVTLNAEFHSIYVIGNEDYLIKCTAPSYPMDAGLEQQMIDLFYQLEFGSCTPFYYIDPYGKNQSLLSLADGELDPVSQRKKNGILISMDIGKVMRQQFPELRKGEQYLLTDNTGNVVFSLGEGYASGEWIGESLMDISRTEQEWQSSLVRLESGRYLFTSAGVGEEFLLIHLLPVRYILESVSYIGFIFSLIVILMIFLVAVLAFGMSNIIYRPIDAVVRTVEHSGQTTESRGKEELPDGLRKTELASLAATYSSMVKTLNDIRRQKDWESLSGYLTGKGEGSSLPEWVEETYGKQGIYLRVLCIRPGDAGELQHNNTKEAVRFEIQAISNVVEKILGDFGDVITHHVDQDDIAVILFAGKSIPEEEIIESAGEIVRLTRELLAIDIGIGISNQKEQFVELAGMYQMARAATAYRYMYGVNAVITEKMMAARVLNHLEPVNLEPILVKIRESNREGFIREYTALIETLKEHSIQTAREQLLLLAVEMRKYERSLRYCFDPLSAAEYERLNSDLAEFEYIDDEKQYFLDMADQIWMILIRARQSNKEDIVEKASAYLEEHYADASLSAQYMADMYRISPSYFSRLFNERKGCAFPDYLATLRIEKARSLLLSETNLSIQDICNMVGYTSASYFTASFKKKYGLTPGQFRKNRWKKEKN